MESKQEGVSVDNTLNKQLNNFLLREKAKNLFDSSKSVVDDLTKDSAIVRKYFIETRGISEDTFKKLNIRYLAGPFKFRKFDQNTQQVVEREEGTTGVVKFREKDTSSGKKVDKEEAFQASAVIPVLDKDNNLVGVHVIRLTSEGKKAGGNEGKEYIGINDKVGKVVLLKEGKNSNKVYVAEGIETAASVATLMESGKGDYAVLTSMGIDGLPEVLPYIKTNFPPDCEVVLLKDHDVGDNEAHKKFMEFYKGFQEEFKVNFKKKFGKELKEQFKKEFGEKILKEFDEAFKETLQEKFKEELKQKIKIEFELEFKDKLRKDFKETSGEKIKEAFKEEFKEIFKKDPEGEEFEVELEKKIENAFREQYHKEHSARFEEEFEKDSSGKYKQAFDSRIDRWIDRRKKEEFEKRIEDGFDKKISEEFEKEFKEVFKDKVEAVVEVGFLGELKKRFRDELKKEFKVIVKEPQAEPNESGWDWNDVLQKNSGDFEKKYQNSHNRDGLYNVFESDFLEKELVENAKLTKSFQELHEVLNEKNIENELFNGPKQLLTGVLVALENQVKNLKTVKVVEEEVAKDIEEESKRKSELERREFVENQLKTYYVKKLKEEFKETIEKNDGGKKEDKDQTVSTSSDVDNYLNVFNFDDSEDTYQDRFTEYVQIKVMAYMKKHYDKNDKEKEVSGNIDIKTQQAIDEAIKKDIAEKMAEFNGEKEAEQLNRVDVKQKEKMQQIKQLRINAVFKQAKNIYSNLSKVRTILETIYDIKVVNSDSVNDAQKMLEKQNSLEKEIKESQKSSEKIQQKIDELWKLDNVEAKFDEKIGNSLLKLYKESERDNVTEEKIKKIETEFPKGAEIVRQILGLENSKVQLQEQIKLAKQGIEALNEPCLLALQASWKDNLNDIKDAVSQARNEKMRQVSDELEKKYLNTLKDVGEAEKKLQNWINVSFEKVAPASPLLYTEFKNKDSKKVKTNNRDSFEFDTIKSLGDRILAKAGLTEASPEVKFYAYELAAQLYNSFLVKIEKNEAKNREYKEQEFDGVAIREEDIALLERKANDGTGTDQLHRNFINGKLTSKQVFLEMFDQLDPDEYSIEIELTDNLKSTPDSEVSKEEKNNLMLAAQSIAKEALENKSLEFTMNSTGQARQSLEGGYVDQINQPENFKDVNVRYSSTGKGNENVAQFNAYLATSVARSNNNKWDSPLYTETKKEVNSKVNMDEVKNIPSDKKHTSFAKIFQTIGFTSIVEGVKSKLQKKNDTSEIQSVSQPNTNTPTVIQQDNLKPVTEVTSVQNVKPESGSDNTHDSGSTFTPGLGNKTF